MCAGKESVELRYRLIVEPGTTGGSVTEICRRHQVSRKTRYKWLKRYEAEGLRAGYKVLPGGRGTSFSW
jgi:transposase-like protein